VDVLVDEPVLEEELELVEAVELEVAELVVLELDGVLAEVVL
jgi:hypothetical protein